MNASFQAGKDLKAGELCTVDPATGKIIPYTSSIPTQTVCPICRCVLCTCTSVPKTEHSEVKNYGWVCPVCGRGNSPFTSTCPCQPFPRYEVTCLGVS